MTIDAKFLTLNITEHAFATSYRLTVAALLMIYFGGAITDSVQPRLPINANPGLATIACIVSVLAILITFKFFIDSGVFRNISHADILARKKLAGSIPYMLFLIPAFSILCLKTTHNQRWMIAIIIIPFIAINFTSGSRRHVLSLLIILTAATVLKGSKVNFRRFFLIGGGFILLGLFVGATRGNVTSEKLFSSSSYFWTRLQFGLTEFTRPYTALLYHLDHRDTQNLLLGSSFTDSLNYLVPSFLRTHELPVKLSTLFAQELSSLLGFKRPIGHGFFPVAETIVNFPMIFTPLIFLLLSLLTGILNNTFYCSRYSFMIPTLCVINFTIGRGGFQSIGYFFTYTIIIGTFILLLYTITNRSRQYKDA